ncbi:hypothetical protein [Mycobacterium pseudoshottsii]|uniref:PPE family protein n=1 Tax=Mycobacterium marinum DL240490 TaxID=459420 RepID=B6CLM7_MYCMR|nr:hypothetical protein [Mycobacterium pseudoshottsii]ACA50951.1 hypothetical protein MUDP_034 [Mycobacterium marinum DL240490]
MGLPGGWWASVADGDTSRAAAGLRAGSASSRGAAMAPGMYGPMGAAARSRNGSNHVDVAEADKAITVATSAHTAPVLTSEGVVHVGQGG